MEQRTPYSHFPETDSCYLDGRYFNIVLGRMYEGVVRKPLKVKITRGLDGSFEYASVSMKHSVIREDTPNIIRVIIEATKIRHSALLIVNIKERNVWFWNPKSYHGESELDKLIVDRIRNYISHSLGRINFIVVDHPVPVVNSPQGCSVSGYCNAFVIKYASDWIEGKKIDLSHIRRYTYMIESHYKNYLTGEPDVEYDALKGALIGGGIGLGVGVLAGAVGGPGGMLLGGTIGGLTGAAIGGAVGSR